MARVFVGNLPTAVVERDIESEFDKFGRVRSISVKFPQRPPPFAFIVRSATSLAFHALLAPVYVCSSLTCVCVCLDICCCMLFYNVVQEYEDERDASDAVRSMHGYAFRSDLAGYFTLAMLRRTVWCNATNPRWQLE